jgi:hypothetical protein
MKAGINRKTCAISLILFCYLILPAHVCSEPGNSEFENAEQWFESDFKDTDEVNEGQLEFIAPVTDKNVLSSIAVLTVDDASMTSGFVKMQQCYRNLDAVPLLDIVYQFKAIKNLQIERAENIEKATVKAQTLELENVGKHAEVCVTAMVKVIEQTDSKHYVLRYGPYYRRFLDGYYPYHISLTVNYPSRDFSVENIIPHQQEYFQVKQAQNRLSVDTWFEGELLLEFVFRKTITE